MAVQKFESRFNFGAFLMFLTSFLALVAGYICYSVLPESEEFINSVDVSGETTVKVFTVVPVLFAVACVIFLAFLIVCRRYCSDLALSDNKFGDKVIGNGVIKAISYVSAAALTVMLIVSTYFAFLLYAKFRQLGFVAPVANTVFETYERFILADCIIHFFFLVLTSVKMTGFSITGNLGRLFIKK